MGFISIEYKCDECKKLFKCKHPFKGKNSPYSITLPENKTFCEKCSGPSSLTPQKKDANTVIVEKIITNIEKRIGKVIPIEDIVSEAKSKRISKAEINKILKKLRFSGDVFEPRSGFLARI